MYGKKLTINSNIMHSLRFVGQVVYNGVNVAYIPCVWTDQQEIIIRIRRTVIARGALVNGFVTFRPAVTDKYYQDMAARVIRMITE
jgi:hypothetical protein